MCVGSLPNLVIILSILKNEKNPTEYVFLALFSAHKFQVAIWELGQEGEGCVSIVSCLWPAFHLFFCRKSPTISSSIEVGISVSPWQVDFHFLLSPLLWLS